MYTVTQIYKKWNLSKHKIEALLKAHNVTPVKENEMLLTSMVYLQRYNVIAKYYDEEIIEDIFKEIPIRQL